MNSFERIYAAIHGKLTDRVPFSIWKHFPDIDYSSIKFAKALIAYQKKFDFDFIKITPSSGYMGEIFGGKFDFKENAVKKGIRENKSFIINNNQEWKKIKDIKINEKILNREIKTIKLLKKGLINKVPIFQTIPNAITVAKILRGDKIFEDIKNNSRELRDALSYINDIIFDFSDYCIKFGTDGIFYFTQLATYDFLTEEEYKIFGQEYDLEIINKMRKKTDLIILHIHGSNIMFDLLKDYPVHIINWHDRLTKPSLYEAKKIFKGALLGGIDEDNVLVNGSVDDVKKQVRDAIKQTDGKGLIIGPGCVLPINTPEENIRAIREVLLNG